MHQDEVSFVFGQPIFMFPGYTNCSVPGWDGVNPGCVYNDDEVRQHAYSRSGRCFVPLRSSLAGC